jgi:hypothetical protein
MCSTIYWMLESNIELNFDFTKEDQQFCEALMDTNLYVEAALGYEESWHLQTYESLQFMREIIEQKGFYKHTAKYEIEIEDAKMIHFAGHNENLLALMRAFDFQMYSRVPPGSALF